MVMFRMVIIYQSLKEEWFHHKIVIVDKNKLNNTMNTIWKRKKKMDKLDLEYLSKPRMCELTIQIHQKNS